MKRIFQVIVIATLIGITISLSISYYIVEKRLQEEQEKNKQFISRFEEQSNLFSELVARIKKLQKQNEDLKKQQSYELVE